MTDQQLTKQEDDKVNIAAVDRGARARSRGRVLSVVRDAPVLKKVSRWASQPPIGENLARRGKIVVPTTPSP